MLILSITFFAVFLGLQHTTVKEKLLQHSLDGVDVIIFILGCFLTILFSNEKFIDLQDIFYGYTWTIGLEYRSLLFFMTFIAFVIKNEKDEHGRVAQLGAKELSVIAALFAGVILSSIIVWSIILLVIFSTLRLKIKEKLFAQALPFSLVLIEIYSASSLGFLTYNDIDKYEALYQNIMLSSLVSALFVFGAILLLVKRNVGNLTNSLCLSGYIFLYSKVSPFFNTEEFFSLYLLSLSGFWLFYTIRHGAVIESFYRQSKQVLFLIVLSVLVGATGSFVGDSLFWTAIMLLSNTLLMQNHAAKNEFSILVVGQRVLSTVLFAMASLIGIGYLVYSSIDAIAGANILILLGFSLACWQMLLRLNYSHEYDLKSELLSDFSDGPFVVSLGLVIILMLAIIYLISSTHLVGIVWLYALATPAGLILLANIFKRLKYPEKHAHYLYGMYPDNLVHYVPAGISEIIKILIYIVKIVIGIITLFFQSIKNLLEYLSYVSDSVLDKGLKYKVHAIFIIWIVLIGFVTSWSL